MGRLRSASAKPTGEAALLLLRTGFVKPRFADLICSKFRHALWGFLLWLFLLVPGTPLLAQQAGSLDASFNPGYGVDGTVSALAVQADGKVIVAGQFSHVNGQTRGNLARLNPDGSLDPSFQTPVFAGAYSSDSTYVNAVALQPDGRLLVGGVFTQVGGERHAGLVRLNADGGVDGSFAPSFDRLTGVYHTQSLGVYALAVQADGKIVAVGVFSSVNDQARRGVARLNADGTLDPAFDPATPARVYPPQGLSDDAFSVTLGPAGALSNAEVFSLLLADTAFTSSDAAVEAAKTVLSKVRSLGVLARCSPQELVSLTGISVEQAVRVAAAGEFGRRVVRESSARLLMDDPQKVCQLMAQRYRGQSQESVCVLLLDTKGQLLRIEQISLGSLNASHAHPVEVFRAAIVHGAYAIVLTHNHPSGNPSPSLLDKHLTRRLAEAGKTLGIRLDDHVIIGEMRADGPAYYSFKEEGLLEIPLEQA